VASQARSTGNCLSTDACFTPSSRSNTDKLVGSVVTVIAVPLDTRYEQFYGARPRRGGGLLNRRNASRSKPREVN
jgi:hypothetical protein